MRISRRDFINLSTVSGCCIALGILPTSSNDQKIISGLNSTRKEYNSPFIKISANGAIKIIVPVPEIGQGIRKSLPKLIAEQLNTTLEQVSIVQAEANDRLGNMSAAGSNSIMQYYNVTKRAGAILRTMLTQAAANYWSESPKRIFISNGYAIHERTHEKIPWGELLHLIESMEIPEEVIFLPRITKGSKPEWHPDAMKMITGKAVYGIDSKLPGMKFATISRPPSYGSTLVSYNSFEAEKVEGVIKVFELKPESSERDPYAEVLGGVVIVAENTWAAIKAKKMLQITWSEPPKNFNSDNLDENIQAENDIQLRLKGDPEPKLPIKLEATYELPFMAHACMEPMNFTASFGESEVFLIGPTQRPLMVQEYVSRLLNIPLEKVRVQTTLIGGGFGRRLAIDYAIEAILIAKQLQFPVKTVWTREDDITHDYFRSASIHKLTAAFDNSGALQFWKHSISSQPIGNGPIYEVQGAADIPLDISNISISWSPLVTKLRIGSWRSVSHSFNSYVVNSWIDELANSQGINFKELAYKILGPSMDEETVKLPLPGRRGTIVTHLGRLKNVIEKVSEISGWGRKLIDGEGMGMAFCVYKTSYAAHVAHVRVINKKVSILKIYAVMDCGEIVDEPGAKAQMEGSIMDGISTLFFNAITFENGRPLQSNFNNFYWPRISNSPEIHLELIESKENPGGAGEPPYPSVAPALANAIFNASNIRLRKLPATEYGLFI